MPGGSGRCQSRGKDRLRPVLEQVIDERCATLRAKVESQIADGTNASRSWASRRRARAAMFRYFNFNVLRGISSPSSVRDGRGRAA